MRYLCLFLFSIMANTTLALNCDQATITLKINRCVKVKQEKVEEELNSVYKKGSVVS